MRSVWLYDDEEDARKAVDAHDEYHTYRMPSMRNNEADLFVYGMDYARLAAPGRDEEPLSLCEDMVRAMDNPETRAQWQRELDDLKSSGTDTKRDYYAFIARMVRDDVRGRHKAWKEEKQRQEEVQRQNEERLEQLVSLGLDGKASTFTPEDIDLLQQRGLTLGDMQLLGELYKQAEYDRSQSGVHSVKEELNLANMAFQLERSGKAEILTDILLHRIAQDAENRRETEEESGFFEKAGTVLGNAAKDVGKTLMTVQSALEPTRQEKRPEYRIWIEGMRQMYGMNEDEAKSYIEKGMALSGGMRNAREQGESATKERYGLTGFSVASTIGDLGAFLAQLSNPATASAWFADSVDDKYRRYEYADPDGGQGGHFARALGYTAGEYAAFKYAPKMVWSGAGQLFGATVGKIGGGAVGRGVGNGMAWMNKSALGAATMGAIRGVGDVGVIIPGATGALHSLYDVVPGTDDTLDAGLQELEGLWKQLGKGEYWAETLVTGGAFGGMNVPMWRKAQGLAKATMRERFEEFGGDPEFFEKNKGRSAQDLAGILQGELERERNEDKGGMLQRAISVARKKMDALEISRQKADNAVKAMLQLRGFEIVPEGDKFRLYYEGTVEDGKSKRGGKSILLDETEVDTFVEMQMDAVARDTAHRMRSAVAKGRMAEALKDMDVRVDWLREGLDGRKVEEAAKRARERVEVRTKELMEEKKAGEKEARKQALAEVHEDILDEGTAQWLKDMDGKTPSLGDVISYGGQWARRGVQAEGAGVKAAGSNANVLTRKKADGTLERVLRVALGASPKEVAEELGEQSAVDFMKRNGWNVIEAFRVLEHLRQYMKGKGDEELAKASDSILSLHRRAPELYDRVMSEETDAADIHALDLADEKEVRADVVEGLSRLMFSDLMMDELTRNPELPDWARALGMDLTLDLGSFGEQLALAKGLMDARAEGWLPEAVRKVSGGTEDKARALISSATEAVRGALRGKAEPEPGEYLDALYRVEKAQAELDARFGAGVAVAPERFDAFETEAREGQKKLDNARAEEEAALAEKAAEDVAETEAEHPEMSHDDAVKATNEKKNGNRQEQIATAADAEHDPDFVGGVCQTVEDPQGGEHCKLGFLPVEELKVMSNFKLGSDVETGVVEPLKGDYRADHDPIRVWRKEDGTLIVISGRHRLDAAKRAGMDKIVSYVYEESALHNEQWARRFDIESNIRDNQATALEVALYVRGEWNDGRALTEEEIAHAGIARKGKAGAIGCEIARKGAQSVIDAWRNGQLTEQQAFWIASFMPGNDRAQNAGVKMATSGDVTKGEILNTMEAAHAIAQMGEELGVRAEVDLWGNEIGIGDEFEQFVGRYVTRKRNEIGKDISYIGTTATKRNAAEMAKKYGVDVKDPEAMKRKRDELAQLQQRWKNPYIDPELMEEMRNAYRKERGIEEADVEDDGAQGAVELPGEAEGQGMFFSRDETPAEIIWRSKMLALRQQERGVGRRGFVVDMSVHPQGVFSVRDDVESLEKVQERWNKTLDDYAAGKLEGWRRPLTFGKTPAVLQMLGAPDLRMTITRDVLDKVTRDKHKLDIAELRKLPDSMHEPLAVFRSSTQLDSMVVLTELHEEGKPVVVAVHLDSTQGHIRVNKIASVYGKNGIAGMFNGTVLYADKTKIGKWSTTEGLQLPKVVQSISRGNRILNPGDIVKWKNENNLPQVMFSVRDDVETLEKVQERWNKTLDDYAAGKLEGWRRPLTFGKTPAVLQMLGAPDLRMTITRDVLDKVTRDKHKLDIAELRKLPDSMHEPLAVFRSSTQLDSMVVLTELHEEGKPVVVAVHLNSKEGRIVVNRIASVYGKDNFNGLFNMPILYADRTKIGKWLTKRGLQLPTMVPSTSLGRKILNPGDIVKWKNENNLPQASFSIFGMGARGAAVADERGETYVDPADGKKKWVVSDAVSRLRDNFTPGQLNVPVGGHKDTTLGAILHFPAMFENYPELSNVRVRLYKPKKPDGCRGYLCPTPGRGEAAYIGVNMGACNSAGQVLATLRHESQHWIQSKEGHALGAGVSSMEEALVYLDEAIKQRKEAGVDDAWSRDNLAFLENLRERVGLGDEAAIAETYIYSRGEQEARFTGEGLGVEGAVPVLGGRSGEEPSHYTIAITQGATDLGGVTFSGMGRFAYLMENRLLPTMEFTHDRQVMQMKETVVRMMNQLNMLPEGGADGLKLAADGLNVLERLTSLLPDTYRMALEPYRLYFTYYSVLHGTGNAEYAGGVIPMAGWDKRMTGAMHKMAMQLLEGDVNASDFEYWTAHPELVKEIRDLLDEVRPDWEEAQKAAKVDIDDDGSSKAERSKKVRDRAIFLFSEAHPEYFETVNKALGVIRADKLMDKFLQRVALQLEHYRKDRTLGKMRRVVDSVQVLPDEDGKPRKGMMTADDYRHLQDLVALLEMTRSERESFLDLYDGEHEGKKSWDDLENDELVEVEVYDADGKKKKVAVSKLEFDVYSSFEQMSAGQAESASRALGEFITTGRQAWQNMEEAAKARIGRLCAPLLEGFTETENERRARELEKYRELGQKLVSLLFNDAQFFDVVSSDAACRGWAADFTQRIADGHANIEAWEKERSAFTWKAICRAAGTEDGAKVRQWLDEMKGTRKSGVVLVPREPDFQTEAEGEARRQLFGLLHRKTKQKNFSPNRFAAVIDWMSKMDDDKLPKGIREELVDKYGRIGDAGKSVLKGEAAAVSLFSEAEFAKFKNFGNTVKARAEKARGKWQEKNPDKVKKMEGLDAAGEQLELSRMEAAYRVLLCEQSDYKDMMALQGYDDVAVGKLREFAGKEVMKLAYELRTKLGERTPQMKELYEKMYGVPFPEVENYFRAYFDAGHESRENKLLGGEGVGNAAGGGKVKTLYTRRKHNAKVDATMDVINAFECAMKEQDTLFAWGQLGQDIKRVLNHRQEGLGMRQALEERIGRGMVQEMERWADMFESISVQHEEFGRTAGKLVRAAGNASAVMILNGRTGSLVKQLTAIFNTLCGSDLVSVWEWNRSMSRFLSWNGKISMKEMAARPELEGRFKGWAASMDKEAALQMPDVKAGNGATAPWTRSGMALMEWLDMRANVVSCCVLYDAVYRKLQKADSKMSREELDSAAMGEVRRALALKSQPMDFRSRSMVATKQSVLSAGMLFLGGESVNTFGNIARLMAKKQYGKAAAVWFAHGAMLQALSFLYNWLTDDKEQWERRSWLHYVGLTVLGPFMGIPLVSTAFSQGIGAAASFVPQKYRPWLPTQSLLPIGDFSRSFGEVKKAFFGNKPSSWQDKCVAMEQALLALLTIGAVIYRNPRTPRDAMIKGGLYGASLILNSLDFLLRGERAFEERALGE